MSNTFSDNGFPLIYATNSSGTEIQGFINVLNEEFYIQLSVIGKNLSKKVNLRGSWKFQQLVQPVLPILEQHLSTCSSILDMLCEIKNTAEQQLQCNISNNKIKSPSVQYYNCLLKQLQEVGWNKVHSMNETLDHIQLQAVDLSERTHYLTLNLPENFPDGTPTFSCILPEEFVFKWSSTKTLRDVCSYFETCLEKYSQFWNLMDEIDECTWVLEPERQSRDVCKRRIAIAPTASLLIIVNPTLPYSIPVCHYMGPESIVAPLRNNFNQNIDQWDETSSLLRNLRMVLELEFPSPYTSKKDEFCVECGMCYAYQLGEAFPDVVCSEANCKQPYHNICLYEWLKSLPTARHSFNTVFGDCPYCNSPIWCTVPDS